MTDRPMDEEESGNEKIDIDDAPKGKLTALDDALVARTNTCSHEMAPQSIVIKTSQSMSDLKSGFREQWEHRQKLRKLEMERKHKYSNNIDNAQTSTAQSLITNDTSTTDDCDDKVPFQVCVS